MRLLGVVGSTLKSNYFNVHNDFMHTAHEGDTGTDESALNR